jgi:large subunit ribosomal protein L13e
MIAAKPRVFKTREKKRHGKGFSREELKKAGTNMTEALKLRIPLDPRRKTAHEENIEAVKTFIAQKKAEQKPKKQKPKKQKPKKPEKKSKK